MAGNQQHGYVTEVGYAGQLATNRRNTQIGGRTITGQKYPLGRGVKWNGSNKEVTPFTAITDTFGGLLLRKGLHEDYLDADGNYGFPPDENVILLTEGDIIVEVETAIGHNDPVFCRAIANGAGKDQIGIFRNDDDGASNTCFAVPNARWIPVWDTSDGGLSVDNLAVLSLF